MLYDEEGEDPTDEARTNEEGAYEEELQQQILAGRATGPCVLFTGEGDDSGQQESSG